MKHKGSSLQSKRFFLYAFLTLIMLAVFIAINIIFSSVRRQNDMREKAARFDSFVRVYSDDYSSIAESLYNLSSNSLVQSLRYNSSFTSKNEAKIKALIDALSFANSIREGNIQFLVYFHDSDRIISSDGFLWTSEFRNKYQLSDDFDFEALKTDRSRQIGIFRRAMTFKSYTYAYRSPYDLASVYMYTSDGATVLAISFDAHIYNSIDDIVKIANDRYAILDNDTGLVLYSNVDVLKDQIMDNDALIEEALGGAGATKAVSGRFAWYLMEDNAADTDFSYQMTTYIVILSIFILIMLALYYLTLELNVFQPIKRILKTLPERNRPMGMYEEIEEALRKLAEKPDLEAAALQSRVAPAYEEMLSQSLLGIRQEADEMLNHSYLCAGIAAETEEERQAAIAAILEKTNGKLLCVISGFSILYLPFDSLDADGISALSQGIRGRVAVGISRIHTSISEAPLAYQETADVFRKPCGELPVLYSAGRDGIEDVIGLPLEAREAEALLGGILRGNSEAALAFVNRLLDKTAPRSIDRKRYVTGFLLNLFELAHNGIKQKAYDSQEVMDELGGTLDYEVMCAVIRDCCEKLTRSYASSDDDLIAFLTEYAKAHYRENINLQSAAELSGFSYSYASHCFSEKTGMTFTDYLNSVRVGEARILLEKTNMLIGDISERTGFGSVNTFMRNFRKYTGTTPDAYRKAAAQKNAAGE